MPEYKPKVLICRLCGEEFIFTSRAQQYFAERGHTRDPKLCKSCYRKRNKSPRKKLPDDSRFRRQTH